MTAIDILQILVFLLPGLLAEVLLNALVVRPKDRLDTLIEALLFSMVIYLPYSLAFAAGPVVARSTAAGVELVYRPWAFLLLTALSVALPLALAYLLANNHHLDLAKRLRVTHRASRDNVWLDVFYGLESPVIVDFANGRRLYGWPMLYGDRPDDPYLYLRDPYWIEGDAFQEIDAHGILVTPAQKIELVEVLHEWEDHARDR